MLSKFFKRIFSGFPSNLPEQETSVKKIEITVTRFKPEPAPVTATFASGVEALAWLDLVSETDCVIDASAYKGKFSIGDFCLWCSGDWACARIGEHRDHNARHPDSAFVAPDSVGFKDDDGSLYFPARELLLPRQLATDALCAWLVDQEHPPMLLWD